jgi:hypothetical protein
MENWMVPVGVPVPVTGLTVAVKVMLWPRFADGFRFPVTTVEVGRSSEPTVWVSVGLELARNAASPP